jgi:transcriptional regulator of arginine metabolism
MPLMVGISFSFGPGGARLSAHDGGCYAVPGSRKRDAPGCQTQILELVQARPISSQEELRRLLAGRGVEVTQATLSRDLRDLGLARVTTEDGVRYVIPESLGDGSSPALDATLAQFLASIDGVSELIVLRTLPGGAQPVAEAIDATGWPEILGTIGGENTILVVCKSAEARIAVTRRLSEIAGIG